MAFAKRDLVSKLAFVGIAGGITANTYVALRGKEKRAWLLLERTAFAGGVGLAIGLTSFCAVKLLRGGLSGVTLASSTIAGTISGAVTGLTYCSIREILSQEKFAYLFPTEISKREYYLSTFSGGSCGVLIGILTRSGITWSLVVGGVGCLFAGLIHLSLSWVQRVRYRMAVQRFYPQYAERLLNEEQKRLEEYNSNESKPGELIAPFKSLFDFFAHVDDRINGTTGVTGTTKRILERKMQIEALQAEEEKVIRELENIKRTPH